MNPLEETDTDSPVEAGRQAFGGSLHIARKAQSLSINEVARATHLSEAVIDAIEQSDVTRLPPPTFVQGYLRIYARHLGLSEAQIIEDFNRAIPHQHETELHPRSTLPAQANSHSPLMRSVSTLLVLIAVLALVYGAYDYYVRTAETIGLQQATDNMSARERGNNQYDEYQQHAVISEDGELIVVAPEKIENEIADADIDPELPGPENAAASTTLSPVTASKMTTGPDVVEVAVTASVTPVSPETAMLGANTLELYARNDSWVEIVDAGGIRLYHNLAQKYQTLKLQGEPPFDVFLGNAPAVQLSLNGIDVVFSRYTRSNNVARFSVSLDNETVVFH